MSSFFTIPASQRKRKREDVNSGIPGKRPNINTEAINKGTNANRDDSISGSSSDDNAEDQRANDNESEVSISSDDENETGAERRLRLAEKYLQNIKGAVHEVGYDAEEIDRDLIAERLQNDSVRAKKLTGCLITVVPDCLCRPKAKDGYIAISQETWISRQPQRPSFVSIP